MKRITVITMVLLVLAMYVQLGSTDSYAIGQMKLSGTVIDIEQKVITASGKAKLTAPNAVISADNIRLDLAGKGGGVTKGTATGNVVIHAKQIDKTNGTRTVDATSQTAVMIQGQNNIVLRGNVVVKMTDPEQLGEPGTLTSDVVTVFLNENRIRAESVTDKQPELVVTPKEKSK
ncbi:MAG: LPS export ABC transporter periplasmic protein LptC [Armatimonadota bacterium]